MKSGVLQIGCAGWGVASGQAALFDTGDRVLECYSARVEQRQGEVQGIQEALTNRPEQRIDRLRQLLDRPSTTGERNHTTAPSCCCLAEPQRGSARALP